MGIQDVQALPDGPSPGTLPCFFHGPWRFYILSVLFFPLPTSPSLILICLFCSTYFRSIMLTSRWRFPPMVSSDWRLCSWRTSHSDGPQEPGLQPFVIPPGRFFESGSLRQPKAFSLLQCIHRLPLAHSTTREPLRTGPRVLQLPSCNSSILSSIQHFFLATSRTPTRPSRQPAAAAAISSFLFPSPHPPPSLIIVPPSTTRPADSRLRPLARTISDRPTDEPTVAARTG